MGIVYETSNLLMKGTLRAFGDVKVEGKENVPRKGALIVVSNHLSDIDPGLLNVIIPRHVQFMATAALFQIPIVAHFFKAYGAYPIREDGREFYSINQSLRILKRNEAMGIFPEGGKNPDALGRAMLGAGIIATLSGAPVLPVGITGTEKMGNWLRVCYPKGKFKVTIGKPFTPPPANKRRLRDHAEMVTDRIMESIAALLPELRRGIYHENWGGERSYTSPPDWWKTKLNNAKQND